jgi:hypothetical protein
MPCSFVTHSVSYLTQKEGTGLRQGEYITTAAIGVVLVLGGFSCVLSLGRGALVLYGDVVVVVWCTTLIWCASLVSGFLHYQFSLVKKILFMV